MYFQEIIRIIHVFPDHGLQASGKGVFDVSECTRRVQGPEIGNRIRLKIKESGLKQKDIVESSGISKAALSNYISGNRVPDTEAIYKISKELGTSIEWILTVYK